MTITTFINTYRENRVNFGIPEFQRNYTWSDNQIEHFFDSLLRKYPIPRFFTWRTYDVPSISMTYFSTRFDGKFRSEPGATFVDDDYTASPNTLAICDGQQRLTSLLIGIQGYNISSNRIHKFLYYNIFTPEDDLDGSKFKILSEKDASINNEDEFYIKVSDIYDLIKEFTSKTLSDLKRELINRYNIEERFNAEYVDLAKENIAIFREAMVSNSLDFVEINEAVGNDLNKAVQFFMRINNFGKNLTENQILFSLLSRFLQSEDYRDLKLKEDFIEITSTDAYSNILKNRDKTYDFFLRCALYTSTERVLFKASNFDLNNCELILNDWPRLKQSIIVVLNLMVQLELDKIIVSLNSVIPVIYHTFRKNGLISASEKDQIMIYIIRANFSKIFGSHGDNLLSNLKNKQRDKYDNVNYQFSFNDLNHNLPDAKSFNLGPEAIEDLLNLKYGNKKTRPILDLLYTNTVHFVSYQVDHIHAQNICKDASKLRLENVPEGDLAFVKQNFDKLSNLQLLQSGCNSGKSDLLISDWINEVIRKGRTPGADLVCLNGKDNMLDYIRDNKVSIPEEYNSADRISEFLAIENFRLFYNTRKEYFRLLLTNLLG
jgi:hypothetical protein